MLEGTPRIGTLRSRRADWAQLLWLSLTLILGKLTLAVVAAVAAMYVFVRLAYYVALGETQRFDREVHDFFQARQPPWFHEPLLAITWFGNAEVLTAVVTLAVIAFAVARRFWPDSATMLLAGAGGLAFVEGLKRLFERPRPEADFYAMGYSFPSGHAFMALTIYGMLAYRLSRNAPPRARRWIWAAAVPLILLVGTSRVLLGVHYPSDVAAGFTGALFWLWGCLALPAAFQRHEHRISWDERLRRFRAGRERLAALAASLPHLAALADRLAGDRRVPRPQRLALRLLTGYLRLPVNLIPWPVPVLGVADDLLLTSLTLSWTGRSVPEEVLAESWRGDGDLCALLEEIRCALRGLVGEA